MTRPTKQEKKEYYLRRIYNITQEYATKVNHYIKKLNDLNKQDNENPSFKENCMNKLENLSLSISGNKATGQKKNSKGKTN